jgi:hypothetical protein
MRRRTLYSFGSIGVPPPIGVEPKFISPTDPAARWTAAKGGPAVYAYADNYLIDLLRVRLRACSGDRAIYVRMSDRGRRLSSTHCKTSDDRVPTVDRGHRCDEPTWKRSRTART